MGWVAAVDFRRGGDGCPAQPCRNYGKLEKLHNGIVLGAVADGAGTAPLSHVGAKISVRSGLNALRTQSEGLTGALLGGPRDPLINLFAKVMDTVGEAVRDGARTEGVSVPQLATSLTIFFVGPFGLAAMQIGRNLAVYRTRGGDYGMVFDVNHDEDQPETVTCNHATDAMRVGAIRGPVEFLCLASRAFHPVLLGDAAPQPYTPFFRPLDRYASGALDDGDVHRGIREFMRTSDLSRDAEEDLTLALCRYNPGGPALGYAK